MTIIKKFQNYFEKENKIDNNFATPNIKEDNYFQLFSHHRALFISTKKQSI